MGESAGSRASAPFVCDLSGRYEAGDSVRDRLGAGEKIRGKLNRRYGKDEI